MKKIAATVTPLKALLGCSIITGFIYKQIQAMYLQTQSQPALTHSLLFHTMIGQYQTIISWCYSWAARTVTQGLCKMVGVALVERGIFLAVGSAPS